MADSTIRVEFYDAEPVGIELPQTVDLVVKETVPGIKGATASAQVKPATLETGLVVQVPPFVNEGRQDPRQYRNRRVPVPRLIPLARQLPEEDSTHGSLPYNHVVSAQRVVSGVLLLLGAGFLLPTRAWSSSTPGSSRVAAAHC